MSTDKLVQLGDSVIDRVVGNGICVGCGMCAAIEPTTLEMTTNELGEYIPQVNRSSTSAGWEERSLQVCPFSGEGPNEDEIGTQLFGKIDRIQHRKEVGYYLDTFSAYLNDDNARMAATSGGIITWIAKHMLETKAVDAVVCVGAADSNDKLFEYQWVRTVEELNRCKKSRYYPVELSKVIPEIRESDERVLFIGLPCFLKALRQAMAIDPVLDDRIVHTIGLVCGHLKTQKYSAYLARHCGVSEENINTVDFRRKIEGRSAHKYAFVVEEKTASGLAEKQIMMDQVWGSSWGNNLFMLQACECCDDVFSETADIAVGDAWLNEFAKDHRGTSVVLCRSQAMLDALKAGVECGEISLNNLDIERVIETQVGALRQRRVGLSYRLAVAKKQGKWRPTKRVEPHIRAGNLLFRTTQRIRLQLARLSKEAYAEQESKGDGFDWFKKRLQPKLRLMKWINLPRHLPGYARKAISMVLGR